MAKKKSIKSAKKQNSFNSFDSLSISRSLIGLLIVMLAASIFFLFWTYQENIVLNNMFYPFIILTVIAMALLISLLFLINPAKRK